VKDLAKTVRKGRSAYRVLRPYGVPYHRHVVHGWVATAVLVSARLAFPWPLRGLMELVFHQGSTGRAKGVVELVPSAGDPVAWLLGAFVVVVLVWGISEYWQRLAFTRYAVGLVGDVRNAALKRVGQGRSSGSPGEVIATVTGDTGKVKSGITSVLIGISRNGAFFLGVSVILMVVDRTVGLLFLLGGLLTAAAAAVGAARSMPVSRRSREKEGALTDVLHHYLIGAGDLRGARKATGDPDSHSTRLEGATTFAVHTILAISTCAILLVTIHKGRSGELSPGAVFTVLAYVLLMHNKMVGLGRSIVRLGRVVPSAKRLSVLVRGKRPPADAGTTGPVTAGTHPVATEVAAPAAVGGRHRMPSAHPADR
jgi:ABC-type multidrug transport system fused ATPase/permease subunit